MNWALRLPLLLLLPVLLGACATRLQTEFDRAMRIEASCTAIREAVPAREKQARNAMFDAVAIRLVGTCVEENKRCFSGAVDAGGDDVASALGALSSTLSRQQLFLKEVANQAGYGVQVEFQSMLQEYGKVQADLEARQTAVVKALSEVRSALRMARDTVFQAAGTGSNAASLSCQLRSECIQDLARTLRREESTVYSAIDKLKLALSALAGTGKDAMHLLEKAANLKSTGQHAMDAVKWTLGGGADATRRDVQLLEQSVQLLSARLENGRQALNRLLSGDVQSAAVDFLMVKASSKAAERTLALIDGLLSGIDRTIDKMDDHLLGAATLANELFSEKIQQQFDRVFVEVIAKHYTNPTAKLAFASAACERLGLGNAPALKNSSMFSPFLFSTLINIGYELTEKGQSKDRKEELARMRDETFDEVIKKMPALTEGVVKAYDMAISASVMPPLQQQVAQCVNIELQLSGDRTLSSAQVRESSERICANEIAAATVAGISFKEINLASATRAIKADVPLPASYQQLANSEANVLSAALNGIAAALKPSVGRFDALCKRIEQRVKGARCDSSEKSAVVEFDATFPSGQTRDQALELSLASLSEVVNSQPMAYVLLVQGYASRKLPACPEKLPPGERRQCSIRENEQLAYQRANWARDMLLRRMAPRHRAESHTGKLKEPLSFDAPGDRRIRITFEESAS